MSKAHPPELKKFMDRKMSIKVNGGRKVEGVLRGFDPFMNLVIDDAIEYRKDNSSHTMGMCVIRGNSVLMIEAMERI
ncbi:Oidioi.mRNA.OKI2018_I69.PAR.g10402.t1.cds [Oikopleura dioica]|uniref:Small nuclear ribonucleoprotein G n=1 Tax=Oikopleura dioica TaxID=34765 RepID=A0ABN7RQD3_OIKDI|nr:Oidioi.mRNA.OKI2018_I69.PAR.g10402.t1.cds [Oikopleura dioica]